MPKSDEVSLVITLVPPNSDDTPWGFAFRFPDEEGSAFGSADALKTFAKACRMARGAIVRHLETREERDARKKRQKALRRAKDIGII